MKLLVVAAIVILNGCTNLEEACEEPQADCTDFKWVCFPAEDYIEPVDCEEVE
ncbi:hypothetical protein [Vibrio paucivorans]|uniref:Uncharacterized protein n=1 Tax=Vibrio paucivorans TaxID=2829489 RepID=A0A9X3CIV1_9VIBR|nr:hypothetical protein [Vibrio paucivorans]MCW8336465.1 hypothetical protein [Vibrio paucivorans]